MEERPTGGENQTPDLSLSHPETVPDGAIITPDGEVLFKQTNELFKQIHDTSGRVIGLMYKGPKMDRFTTLSEAQVRSRYNIYLVRSQKEQVSGAVMAGVAVWRWALSLYGTDGRVRTENMETIHEPVEAAEA